MTSTLRCAGAMLLALTLPLTLAADERLASSAGEIVLRPLVHATVQIEFGGRSIYIDPWTGADLSSAPKSDLIIVTDADAGAHHLDVKALAQA